jgi:hypothetical protein
MRSTGGNELGVGSHHGDQVGGHEDLDGVGLRADAEVHEEDAEDVGLAKFGDFPERCGRFGAGLLDLLEDGGFIELAPDDQGGDRDEDAGEEDEPPAPGQHVVRGQGLRGDPHQCAQGSTGGGADHDQRGQLAAGAGGCRFGEQRCAAGLFGAGAEALGRAAHAQQDRGEQADLVEGGKQADGQGCAAHQEQRDHEDPLAAEAVAEVGEEDAAERTEQEADGEGGEAGDQRSCGGDVGEEQFAEDKRGGGAVDDEVIQFEGGADEAGDGGLPDFALIDFPRGEVRCCGHFQTPLNGCPAVSTSSTSGPSWACILVSR